MNDMNELTLIICVTIVIVMAIIFRARLSYHKGRINLESGIRKKNHRDSARISFNDVYNDIDEETENAYAKIKSVAKSTFIQCFKDENKLSYNDTLNHMDLKRYVSLLIRSKNEVLNPGLIKKVFRKSFPNQSNSDEFNRVCDHETKDVLDSSHDFVTEEWTLDFSRGAHLRAMQKPEFNRALYAIIRNYYIKCIRIKEDAAKSLEMEYSKQGFSAEYFLDEFRSLYDSIPKK